MKERRELDLLVDLAKLLKKYGPEPFDALAELLSSPRLNEKVSQFLVQISEIRRTQRESERNTKPRQRPSVPRALLALKTREPEKYELLMEFYNELTAKKVLPSLNDFRQFASEFGLPDIRYKSRQPAISSLIDSLARCSYSELLAKIQALKKYPSGDRSLAGWSRIILGERED